MTSTRTYNNDGHASGNRHNAGQPDDRAPLLSGSDSQTSGHKRQGQNDLGVDRLLALTCINGGLQVFFATVMANLSPYLQNLGLSKSATASIVVCLPLSGAFIGPIAGALSDRLESRFGRRRPIIFVGAILTVVFLCLLAWSEQLFNAIGGCRNGCGNGAVAFAVACTICMSIAVQPVQSGVRSLMVDIAPSKQQSTASSYASRIQGASAIFSFFASSRDLPSLNGLGKLTQFQCLALLNIITLGSTVLLTCVTIKEEDSRGASADSPSSRRSALAVIKHIFQTVKDLKGKIRQTCKTQFSSWFAWFPLLYYTTTYIGELDPTGKKADHGAQAGSLGSLSFAIVGFVFVLGLPAVLPYAASFLRKRQPRAGRDEDHNDGDDAEIDSVDLRGLIWLWTCTQPFLGVLLVVTLAAVYQWQGIALIAAAGLPWAVTQWVPFAIVGYEISILGLTGQDERADSQAGAILGVHNMAISLPQVVSGLVSSLTYKIAEGAGSQVPTAWVLASSGTAAFVAGILASRML